MPNNLFCSKAIRSALGVYRRNGIQQQRDTPLDRWSRRDPFSCFRGMGSRTWTFIIVVITARGACITASDEVAADRPKLGRLVYSLDVARGTWVIVRSIALRKSLIEWSTEGLRAKRIAYSPRRTFRETICYSGITPESKRMRVSMLSFCNCQGHVASNEKSVHAREVGARTTRCSRHTGTMHCILVLLLRRAYRSCIQRRWRWKVMRRSQLLP